MVGCKQIHYFKESSNYKEPLSHVFDVNNLKTNIPLPHVVHKNLIE